MNDSDPIINARERTAEPSRPAEDTARGDSRTKRPFDLWGTVHGALRGRYRLACMLAAAGAMFGASAGAMLGKRLYTATGLVRIASVLPQVMRETDQNKPIAMFDGFIQAQRDLMVGREMILAALGDETWTKVDAPIHIPSEEEFAASLMVETRPRSDHLRVTFTGKDPLVAATAVRSIVSAFQRAFTRDQERVEAQRTEQLNTRRVSLRNEWQRLHDEVDRIAEGRTAAELDPLCTVAGDRVKKLRGALSDIQLAIAEGFTVSQRQPAAARTVSDAIVDDMIRASAVEQLRVENMLAEARSRGCGPENPIVQRLEALSKMFRDRIVATTRAAEAARSDAVAVGAPKSLQDREENLKSFAQAAEMEFKRLVSLRSRLASLEERATTIDANLRDTEARLDALSTEAALGNRLAVVSGGDRPIAAMLDNRAKSALVGATTGAAVPLAILVARVSLRRRYRFCDEIARDLVHLVPFVGVIPKLTSGPQLRTLAAHGIHDLRARLQPSGPDHPRAYLATSAAPGEGKTSLIVSLGLSFAASGFRTLLIDADPSARELSRKFGIAQNAGLNEAIAGAQPVVTPIRAGFSVLGAGRDLGSDARGFSPIRAARVLRDLQEQFDVILIDADSVHTGTWACILGALVDGVLLAVAQGQEQSLVLDAARHIEMFGANVSGVVFNRAPASDFPEVIREEAQRLPGHERPLPERLKRFGPVVEATLSSLSMTSEDELEPAPPVSNPIAIDAARRAA